MNPFEAVQRAFRIPTPGIAELLYTHVLFWSPLVALIALLFLWKRVSASVRRRLMFAIGAHGVFIVTMFFIIRSKDSWAVHHSILAYPLLLLSFTYVHGAFRLTTGRSLFVYRVFAALFFTFLCVTSVMFWARIPSFVRHDTESPSKVLLNDRLNDPLLAAEYEYIVGNWGMMFYQGLFGPRDQSVVWKVHGISPEDVTALTEAAHARGRKVLLIHLWYHGAAPALRETIGAVTCGKDGDAWVVTAEPGENLRRVFGECS